MKLLTNQIKSFKYLASSIKTNSIIPVLSFLRFKDGYITKSNLESFIIMKADFDGSFLLDEHMLYSFIDGISSTEITVTIEGNTALLTDGKEKQKCPTLPVEDFITLPEFSGEKYTLDNSLITEIKIAYAGVTQELDHTPIASCVIVANGIVGACGGISSYTNKCDEKLPKIILEKQAISMLKNFKEVLFYESDNYLVFSSDDFQFGFIKKDMQAFDLRQFSTLPEGEGIEIPKSEIISFSDSCVATCAGRPIKISIEDGKMIMNDPGYSVEKEKPLSAKLDDFTFNPVFMSKLLKSLPDEVLKFTRAKSKYYISGFGGYVSLIMEMQK